VARALGCELDKPTIACISGMGYHFTWADACCPSGVTSFDWERSTVAAFERLGFYSESYSHGTSEAAVKHAVRRIKKSLDHDCPVIVWGTGVDEFGIINGYDDEAEVFSSSGPQSVPIPYTQLGKTCDVPLLFYQVVLDKVPFDLFEARRASLDLLVKSYRGQVQGASEHTGMRAYDSLVGTLESGVFSSFGFRYCMTCYTEAKQLVASYFRGLASDWRGVQRPDVMADHFEETARLFYQIMAILGAPNLEYKLWDEVSKEQVSSLVPLVRKARESDERAVELVSQALG
jgi:hypothetical protein